MRKPFGSSTVERVKGLSGLRIRLKTRRKLADIVVITICAVITGADEWMEIANVGKELRKDAVQSEPRRPLHLGGLPQARSLLPATATGVWAPCMGFQYITMRRTGC